MRRYFCLLLSILILGFSQQPSFAKDYDVTEVENWARNKMNLIEEEYSSDEILDDFLKIAALGALDQPINEKTFQWLHHQMINEENQIVKDPLSLSYGILALRSMGIDPEDYYGHNLVDHLIKSDYYKDFWTLVAGLWALGTDDYKIAEKEIPIRVKNLLKTQNDLGIWSVGHGYKGTSYALLALAPQFKKDTTIKNKVILSIDELGRNQDNNGDFTTGIGDGLVVTEILTGIFSIEPRYLKDNNFIKSEKTLFDILKKYEIPNTATFRRNKNYHHHDEETQKFAFLSFITYFNHKEKGYSVFDFRWKDKTPYPIRIKNVNLEEHSKIIKKGENFQLPTKAIATMSDNTTKEVDITWDKTPDVNTVGTQTFIGKVEDWDGTLTFTLNIKKNPDPTPKTYTIIFQGNGGSGTMDVQKVIENTVFKLPKSTFIPPKGYIFQGWLVDGVEKETGDEVKVASDMVIKVIWKKVTSGTTNKPSKEPSSKPMEATIDPKTMIETGDQEKLEVESRFWKMTDVEKHWAKDVIKYVMDRGYFLGTSERTFSPNQAGTRAEFITVLGRRAKIDGKAYTKNKMKDVPAGVYYEPYVNWAVEKGIIQGVGNDYFEPNRGMTREEMATILDRYLLTVGGGPREGSGKVFADEDKIASWAKPSIDRLSRKGLLQGRDHNKFAPKADFTRAEVAQVIYNLDTK
ncbi:MAG: S-layer homology domain-containing protein [Tissierellia bacterium]|nr:S-layer homology domain-containing protein [Tissierellia bacterium]